MEVVMRRSVVLAAAVVMAAGFGQAQPSGSGGHLVLNGGGEKPRVVMEKFVELAGGPEAVIVVFPTASERRDTGRYYRKLFAKEYGCSDVRVARVATRRDALRPEVVAMVDAAGGVFFTGGDQRRITEALLDTPAGEAVVRAFGRGAVVGGTSAGTACMSDPMITGDGDFDVITADNVQLWSGLGLFPGVIVDQHFVARQRQNRLLSVVLEHPERLGVGVDEGTAVWVRPDGTFEVLGDGWVMVFDAADASVRRREVDGRTNLGALGVRTDILLSGDVYDLRARTVRTE
jgi:cyanophycinase